MDVIAAIQVLFPAFLGILISKAFSAWKVRDEARIYSACDWAWWVGICLVLMAVSAVWPKG